MKNKRKKEDIKKGISLIVLVITIIVIIILAAAVILTLTGNNPIDNAKQATYLNDLDSFKSELDMYKTTEYGKKQGDFDRTTLDASGEGMYTYIPSMSGKTKYITEFEILDGELIYIGDKDSIHKDWSAMANVFEGTAPQTEYGINPPVLATGMTPIKWSGTTMVDTTVSDTSWYDYNAKQWANARTQDGSMWVWIPKYEYKIPTTHISTEQTIEVNFIKGISKTPTSGYIMHPAFTFGTDELTGIWVAKFEASGTTSAVEVKPNIASLRYNSISNVFTACRNMKNNMIYGWGTSGNGIDTHLMKNLEWGAVAYLSSSIYGKIGEVEINSTVGCITGAGSYETNINQSTTGNIYGIYDMNGCAWEYSATYYGSGGDSTGESLINSIEKYKDIFSEYSDSKKGDAMYETSNSVEYNSTAWYLDLSYSVPDTSYPFYARGGFYGLGTSSGVFAFAAISGAAAYKGSGSGPDITSFRPVIAVGSSL